MIKLSEAQVIFDTNLSLPSTVPVDTKWCVKLYEVAQGLDFIYNLFNTDV